MRYLDPKNDLTFKKVFGQHPHLLKSFLNALLPLQPGQQIVSLEYLPAELVPEIPLLKYSIVDVRCADNYGRQFIVEMQMLWTDSFKHRVLFNASKAYVQQLGKGRIYKGLQPVYALGLVNENFEPDSPHYYHHYQLVHQAHSHKKIDGLELVFIELPKFKAQSISERKLQVLWLRYLTEIKDQTENISPDLMQVPEIREAIEFLEVSSFSKTELLAYDKYWDSVSSERTLIADAEEKGEMRGQQQLLEIIRLHTQGKTVAEIALAVGKSEHEVQALLAQAGLA
jgi:predicted transposase/invertase (TIGR01784 family)